MRLELLEYFTVVTECGSISGAAQRLGVSQPAVSAALKTLEKELGGQLIRRDTHGVSMTPLGYMTLQDARRVISLMRDMQGRAGKSGNHAIVSVCAQPQMSSYLTRNILVPFHKNNPDIDVFVRNASLGEVESHLKSGRSSIAIMLLAPEKNVQGLVARLGAQKTLLYTDERCIFLGSCHPLAEKEELSLDDISSLDLAYYSLHSDMISSRYRQYFKKEYRLAAREDILDLVMRGEAACIQCRKLLQGEYMVQKGYLVQKKLPSGIALSAEAPVMALGMPDLPEADHSFWNALLTHFQRQNI